MRPVGTLTPSTLSGFAVTVMLKNTEQNITAKRVTTNFFIFFPPKSVDGLFIFEVIWICVLSGHPIFFMLLFPKVNSVQCVQ
jgi:hypothetical protein